MQVFVFRGGGKRRHQGLMVARTWEQDHRTEILAEHSFVSHKLFIVSRVLA